MSEEEIIKDLEEVIELHEEQCLITTDEDFEAIQGLLDLYNKKKRDFMKLQAFYSKDYVRKDKIREKIKEYEQLIEEAENTFSHSGDIVASEFTSIKNVLKELLKEE